ncbi:MAG: hypothetical protein JWM75_2184, partial [Sphingomonas bacterium]|nr:hypothetical protein [Sphingomonas bacterium]
MAQGTDRARNPGGGMNEALRR